MHTTRTAFFLLWLVACRMCFSPPQWTPLPLENNAIFFVTSESNFKTQRLRNVFQINKNDAYLTHTPRWRQHNGTYCSDWRKSQRSRKSSLWHRPTDEVSMYLPIAVTVLCLESDGALWCIIVDAQQGNWRQIKFGSWSSSASVGIIATVCQKNAADTFRAHWSPRRKKSNFELYKNKEKSKQLNSTLFRRTEHSLQRHCAALGQ